jgi:hypothetical protein
MQLSASSSIRVGALSAKSRPRVFNFKIPTSTLPLLAGAVAVAARYDHEGIHLQPLTPSHAPPARLWGDANGRRSQTGRDREGRSPPTIAVKRPPSSPRVSHLLCWLVCSVGSAVSELDLEGQQRSRPVPGSDGRARRPRVVRGASRAAASRIAKSSGGTRSWVALPSMVDNHGVSTADQRGVRGGLPGSAKARVKPLLP